MREIRFECTRSHEKHFPTYPNKVMKSELTARNVGQIFIRTAPCISEKTDPNYFGIPKPTKESVDEVKMELLTVQDNGNLEFFIISTQEQIHLTKNFNDKKWCHAGLFLETIVEEDIVCKPKIDIEGWDIPLTEFF